MKKLFLLIASVFMITACDVETPQQKALVKQEDYMKIYKEILNSAKMRDFLHLKPNQRDTIFLLSKKVFCYDCSIELDSAFVKFQTRDTDSEEWLRINIYEITRDADGNYIAKLFYPHEALSLTTILKREDSNFRILSFPEIIEY